MENGKIEVITFNQIKCSTELSALSHLTLQRKYHCLHVKCHKLLKKKVGDHPRVSNSKHTCSRSQDADARGYQKVLEITTK